MSRRTKYDSDPKRAPVSQPPLFYRDGRALTDAERGIEPLVVAKKAEELPPTIFAPLPQAKPRMSDMLVPLIIVLIGALVGLAFKMLFGALVFSGFLAGALAKAR